MSGVKDETEPAIRRHIERFEAEADKMLRRVAGEHIVQARILAQERLRHPGKYVESFTHKAERLLIRVINFHRASQIIEYGSRPHEISARSRKVLRFFKEGMYKFRRSIQHPGTRPLFIMLDSAAKTVPYFEEQCNRLWEVLKSG